MCGQPVYSLVKQQSNLKETFKYTQPAKLAAAFFFCLFFCPLFQIRNQGRVFEEASCRNASHQCSCSSAVLHAAVRASCAVFPIPVVWNRLRSAHPDNRKVVSLSFPTVLISEFSFFIPNALCPGEWECVAHSCMKTTFKSYLRHFCGLT